MLQPNGRPELLRLCGDPRSAAVLHHRDVRRWDRARYAWCLTCRTSRAPSVVGSRTVRLTDGRRLRRLGQEPVERLRPFREPEAASPPPSLWGRRLRAPTDQAAFSVTSNPPTERRAERPAQGDDMAWRSPPVAPGQRTPRPGKRPGRGVLLRSLALSSHGRPVPLSRARMIAPVHTLRTGAMSLRVPSSFGPAIQAVEKGRAGSDGAASKALVSASCPSSSSRMSRRLRTGSSREKRGSDRPFAMCSATVTSLVLVRLE